MGCNGLCPCEDDIKRSLKDRELAWNDTTPIFTKKGYQTSIIQPERCILEVMFELLMKAFFARDIHDDDYER